MRGININFPLNDDKEKNTFFQLTETTKNALAANLTLLLLTQKGERYYMPDYGTNLRRFLFEQNDQITQNDIEKDIKQTVSKFIPQLEIKELSFYTGTDKFGNSIGDNQLNIELLFQYTEDTFTDTGTLELSF
jgi:phage baseplate assembly protein W